MRTLFSTAALILFLGTQVCAAAETDAAPGTIRIRIANVSRVPFSEVVIGFPGHQEDYGPMESGRTSEYRSVPLAYRYASYRIVADGKPYRAMAADYLGETRLQPGSYTYTVDLNGGSLAIGFMIDED